MPTYHYNWFGHDHTVLRAPARLEPGTHSVQVVFAYDGGFGAGGEAHLIVDDAMVATARIERTVPIVFSMSGETFDVGVDTGSPVGDYPHQFACTAVIHSVTLERLDSPGPEILERLRLGLHHAGLSAQ